MRYPLRGGAIVVLVVISLGNDDEAQAFHISEEVTEIISQEAPPGTMEQACLQSATVLMQQNTWIHIRDARSQVSEARRSDLKVEGAAADADIETINESLLDEAHHAQRNTSARRFFLHVGPAKTGTTTIQAATQSMQDYLREDGIGVLTTQDFVAAGCPSLPYHESHSFSVASCFDDSCDSYTQSAHRMPCVWARECICPNLSESLERCTQQFPGCFLSGEHFAVIANITLLASTLNGLSTNTTIIIGYRPFHDLFASKYRQQVQLGSADDKSDLISFDEWATVERMMLMFETRSTHAAWQNYSAYFDDIKVHTLNDEIVPNIICDDFGAVRTCQYVHQNPFTEHENSRSEDSFTGTCLDPERRDLLFDLAWTERTRISRHLTDEPSDWESAFRQDFAQSLSSCFGVR